MQKYFIIFAIGFLVASPITASARVSVDTNEKNYAPSVLDWNESGNADAFSSGLVRLATTESRDASVSVDVDVPSKYEDDVAVFVAYARAEKPYPNYPSGAENIAGMPYLYGYFMGDDGDITEYFTQSSMRLESRDGVYWHVIYGYAAIPNDTESIRLFLNQAERNGITPDGRDAWILNPGLYFVDDESDARDVIDAYRDGLDDVKDEFGTNAYDASYNHDWNPNDEYADYEEGTLLKCSGESDVYSVTDSGTLKLFPNEETFFAWGNTFADVRTISCSELDDYDVTGTWSYDRADYLVKFRGQPAVFTLDNGQYLRLIPDEYTARRMFGSDWTHDIREFSASDMGDYSYGVPHKSLR